MKEFDTDHTDEWVRKYETNNVDATQFGDGIAVRIDWNPLPCDMYSFNPLKLVKSGTNFLRYRPTIGLIMFSGAFFGFSIMLGFIIFKNFSRMDIVTSFLPTLSGTLIFAFIGFYTLFIAPKTPVVFDRKMRVFYRGKGIHRRVLDFDNIHAVQLIPHRTNDADMPDYLFQLNLVSVDAGRLHVSNYSNIKKARKDSAIVADFVNKSLWDGTLSENRKNQNLVKENFAIDPAQFNDERATNTDWYPLKSLMCNHNTLILENTNSTYLKYLTTIQVKLFSGVLLAIGIVLALLVPFYTTGKLISVSWYLLPGMAFIVAGTYYQFFSFSTPVVFDGKKRKFYKGRWNRRKDINFDDIYAVQVIPKYKYFGQNSANYYNYQINLVLSDGKRVHVANYYILEKVRIDAQKIADLLNAKYWDGTVQMHR